MTLVPIDPGLVSTEPAASDRFPDMPGSASRPWLGRRTRILGSPFSACGHARSRNHTSEQAPVSTEAGAMLRRRATLAAHRAPYGGEDRPVRLRCVRPAVELAELLCHAVEASEGACSRRERDTNALLIRAAGTRSGPERPTTAARRSGRRGLPVPFVTRFRAEDDSPPVRWRPGDVRVRT
jgi:hypothetical protein